MKLVGLAVALIGGAAVIANVDFDKLVGGAGSGSAVTRNGGGGGYACVAYDRRDRKQYRNVGQPYAGPARQERVQPGGGNLGALKKQRDEAYRAFLKVSKGRRPTDVTVRAAHEKYQKLDRQYRQACQSALGR